MSVTLEVPEPTFSNGGTVFINMVVITPESMNEVKLHRFELTLPIQHDLLAYPFQLLKYYLMNLGVPQTFLNDHDCDMLANLSRMLLDSIQQRRELQLDYFYMYVMVCKSHCCYNIVNTPCIFAEQVPSSDLVQRMACESGKYSLPAGAATLVRFKVQGHKEANCLICLEEFNSNDDAARLPCSHVYHNDCILKWFVKSGTCPICRFACTQASC